MPQTTGDLGRMVKAKYPAYADMDDRDLGQRVQKKFPGAYDDFVDAPDAGAQMRSSALAKAGRSMDTNPETSPGVTPSAPVAGGMSTGAPANLPDAFNPASGVKHVVRGVEQMASPGLPNKAGGAHEILGGLSRVAAPLAPLAIASAPVSVPLGIAAGTMLQHGVTSGAKALGAPEEYADLGGDVAGILGGRGASELDAANAPRVIRGVGGAVKGGATALADRRTYLPAIMGAEAGRLTGLPHGAEVGGMIGALPSVVRGIGEGWREARPLVSGGRGPSLEGRTPLWQSDAQPAAEASAAVPAPQSQAAPVPITLPSGRVVGPAPVRPIAPPAARSPLWSSIPDQAAETPAVASAPQPITLPSGRVVGRPPSEPEAPAPLVQPKPPANSPASPAAEPPGGGQPEPEQAYDVEPRAQGESYKTAAQTVKARALARMLKIEGTSVEDAAKMTPEEWASKAKDVGVNKPSETSIQRALEELKNLYDQEPPALGPPVAAPLPRPIAPPSPSSMPGMRPLRRVS